MRLIVLTWSTLRQNSHWLQRELCQSMTAYGLKDWMPRAQAHFPFSKNWGLKCRGTKVILMHRTRLQRGNLEDSTHHAHCKVVIFRGCLYSSAEEIWGSAGVWPECPQLQIHWPKHPHRGRGTQWVQMLLQPMAWVTLVLCTLTGKESIISLNACRTPRTKNI